MSPELPDNPFYAAFAKPAPTVGVPASHNGTGHNGAAHNGNGNGHIPVITALAQPYAAAALGNECDTIRRAPVGTRDATINTAVFNMGTLIGAGAIGVDVVIAHLYAAAIDAGQTPAEANRALRTDSTGGLAAGMARPRVVRDLPGPPPVTIIDGGPGTQDTPGAGVPPPQGAPGDPYADAVAHEVAVQRIRRDARRVLDNEAAVAAFREPPWRPTLTQELALPEDEATYTVAKVLPAGGNVLLTAQFKTGKTTLVNSLARALADQRPFLDVFDVARIDGRVALFNYEVDERQYRRWLREVGIVNTDRVVVLNLRGYRMPISAPFVEDWIVTWLAERDVTLWMVDPFARAFTGGKSENDNTEVGTFLDTLDVIKKRAGVSDLILPTHTGRAEAEPGAERARGATRLDDWADVRWFLTRDETGNRYFSATGRDVDVPEGRLAFDYRTRELSLVGEDRHAEKQGRLRAAVLAVVTGTPGCSLMFLRTAVRSILYGAANEEIDKAIGGCARDRVVRIQYAEKNGQSNRYFPAVTTVGDFS